MTRRGVPVVALLLAALAAPASADGDRVAATRLPTCTDGAPFLVYIVDASSDDDCDATGGGTTEAPCLCLDGTYVAMLASGGSGGDSFKTQNTPSGTDPVADSSTDTLNWTAGTGITITGDSSTDTITIASTATAITLDLGDDGGNDSTALAEIAVVGDYYGIASEPSADKLSLDFSKIAPTGIDATSGPAPDWECEFDGDICSGTMEGTGSTSTPVSGTIDPLATVTGDPIYSYSYRDGQLCIQSDESTIQTILVRWSRTPATDMTVLVRIFWQARNPGGGEAAVATGLIFSTDRTCSSNCAKADINPSTGYQPRAFVRNAGTFSINAGTGLGSKSFQPTNGWLVLWKEGDVYRYGTFYDRADLVTPGESTVTKTGTGAGASPFDEFMLGFNTANDLPSIVMCVDYVRIWESIVTEFY